MPKPLEERLSYRCSMRWHDLPPHEEGRYCRACDTVIVDLSKLTRREAIERTREGACGRLKFDVDGRAVFRADTETGLRGPLVIMAALMGGCATSPEPTPERARVESPIGAEPMAPTAGASPAPSLERDGPVVMAPIPEGIALIDFEEEALASYDDELDEIRREGRPTEEQRALTAAKRRRLSHTHPAVPIQLEYLGMIEPFD